MRFLITAGPTREHIDDVRFLSNASSGRMGFAIARAALKAGHEVDIVSGPTQLKAPDRANLVRVTSAQEMYRAAARLFAQADCLIGAAAPADYRPAKRLRGKSKKSESMNALALKPTVDILATLGKRKRGRVIIAFAVEVDRPVANAIAKMERKNADAVVLNAPSAMGAIRTSATILLKTGERIGLEDVAKATLARRIVSVAQRLHADKG